MAYLNVIKGNYPGAGQVDKTAAVNSSETGIVRGSLLRLNSAGEFVRTADDAASHGDETTPGARVFIALHNQNDPDVQKAGVMAALDAHQDMVIETDQYDAAGTYTIGTQLAAGADGKYRVAADDETVIGIVEAAPKKVFDNSAYVDNVPGAFPFNGNYVEVLTVRCLYAPQVSTA